MINKIIKIMIEKKLVCYSEKDIYYYGTFVILFNALILVSFIFLGLLLGKVKESIMFLMFFIPLRTYLGGYHCKTPQKCFLATNLLFLTGIFISEYLEKYFYIIIILFIIKLIYENRCTKRNIHYFDFLICICLIYLVLGTVYFDYRKYIVIAIAFNYMLYELKRYYYVVII